MHIGLIGGIGPAATIAYYDRLTRLLRDAGRPLELTIVQADSREMIANLLADRRDEQAATYAMLITRLQAAGAVCAAITSIGGHFCLAETERVSSLPLVSALESLDEHFVAARLRRVGLLGTEVVMRTRVYGQLRRTEAVAFEGDLGALGQTYLDVAATGVCTDDQRAILFDAGRSMIDEGGAEAIVLAGTDLNLAFAGHDPGYPVVDALDVHVAVLADLAMDQRTIADVRS